MGQCMVTGRMDQEKKDAATRILKRSGLNASSAINLLFDRIIEERSADFLTDEPHKPTAEDWKRAFEFVGSIPIKRDLSMFDGMSKAEIKMQRLAKHGLVER